jgi:hypothetical protein
LLLFACVHFRHASGWIFQNCSASWPCPNSCSASPLCCSVF